MGYVVQVCFCGLFLICGWFGCLILYGGGWIGCVWFCGFCMRVAFRFFPLGVAGGVDFG